MRWSIYGELFMFYAINFACFVMIIYIQVCCLWIIHYEPLYSASFPLINIYIYKIVPHSFQYHTRMRTLYFDMWHLTLSSLF